MTVSIGIIVSLILFGCALGLMISGLIFNMM